MKKTVFITGSSSGIGLATALYFFDKGWNVIATMRCPEQRKTALHEKGLPDLVHLDVADKKTIDAAVAYVLDKYQRVDALVNNAGYAIYGPFEAASREQIARQYQTNVFGLMEVTRAMLPVFRAQKDGVIINVSSMGGRIGFPLYSLYNSTKWAVEGFSESLQYELNEHHIRIKIVEPGVIKTDFYDRSLDREQDCAACEAYGSILKRAEKSFSEGGMTAGSDPQVVAKIIYRAATDCSRRLRYPSGSDAVLVNFLRAILPERLFFSILERYTLR